MTALAVVALFLVSGAISIAQAPSTAYPLLLTAERAQRMYEALRDGKTAIPGEVLVKFRAGSQPAEQARALSVLRAPASASRWIGDVLLLDTPGEPDPDAAAAVLQRQPEVEWAEPNHLRRLHTTPNDPAFADQWNLTAIDLPRAWDINPGGKASVKVAVIDSGVTSVTQTFAFPLWTGSQFETVQIPFRANPDIAAARMLPGRDFIFWDGPVLDMDGHGSHVAGTVLQETNNSLGAAGIAYAATLLPLKVCVSHWELQIVFAINNVPGLHPDIDGGCDDSAVAQALRYAADQGAQVANMSLGGTAPSSVLRDAMVYAIGKGMFISMAAGNDYKQGNPIEYPAAYASQMEGAVGVGAVGPSLKRSHFSSTGSYVELAAPGGDDAFGRSGFIWQTTIDYRDSDYRSGVTKPRFDRYGVIGEEGTSMAAPHVAGVAALLYSQGITNPAAVEAALKKFAKDLGAAGRDDEYGYGLIQPRETLRGMGLLK